MEAVHTTTPAAQSAARRPFFKWARRTLIGMGAVIALILALGFGLERLAQAADAEAFPAPGQMVDIGGLELHFYVTGEASDRPTIVLEAGNGGFSAQWIRVQESLAEHTQVVSYDRAGLGWSESDDQPRDVYRNAAQLRAGLQALQIEPPYILVGHSLGGIFIRAFTETYPEDVAGLVFVDAAHEDQLARMPQDMVELQAGFQAMMSTMASLANFGFVRLIQPMAGTVADLPERQRAESLAFAATAQYLNTTADEIGVFYTAPLQMNGADDLGDRAVIVLTAGEALTDPAMPAGYADVWFAQHAELARLSTRGEHRTIEGATHYSIIMGEAYAQQTADAILDVLTDVE